MVVTCHIHLLDGSEVDFQIGRSAKARALLDLVLLHLDVVEKDYFGLIYRGSSLQKAWLKLDKKIKKQINKRDSKIEFDFAVKFYPTEPTKLKEEITRYQLCLQIRRDLASHLDCSVDKLTHLLSYWLQSEYEGKNDHSKSIRDCMKEFQNPPAEASSAEFIDRVLTLYRSRDGMSNADADNQFLATAAGLRTYGVHFYRGKDTAGNEVMMGISAKGVTEKRDGQGPVTHTWSRVKNIIYKNNKFKVKLLRAPTGGDPRLKKAFLFDSENQVQSIWKNAVDHHVFFRVGEKDKTPKSTKKPKRKGSILRRLSSKKKLKTEMEVQQESEAISRRQPNVTRASSLRRPASLRQSTSSDTAESTESLVGATAVTGSTTYSVPRKPPLESKKSSPEKKPFEAERAEATKPLSPPLTADNQSGTEGEVQDEDEQGEREYKDDDLLDVLVQKKEGNASLGSSSLLLNETIPEEDEEEHLDTLPSPRKRHHPVQYPSVRDDDVRSPPSSYQLEKEHESRARPIETNLDEEDLHPAISLIEKEQDPPGDRLLPFPAKDVVRTEEGYDEVSEDVDAEVVAQPKEVVRFSSEIGAPSKANQSKQAQDQETEGESSRKVSTSSEEGEDCFDSKKDHEIQVSLEDEELKFQTIPIPTFDDLHRHPVDSETEEDNFAIIKEYVPKIRRESTEGDSEEDSVEDDASDVSETREKELLHETIDFPFADESANGYHLLDEEEDELLAQTDPENFYKTEIEDILGSPGERNLSPYLRDSDDIFDQIKEGETEQHGNQEDKSQQDERKEETKAEFENEPPDDQKEVENDEPITEEPFATPGIYAEISKPLHDQAPVALDTKFPIVDPDTLYAPGDAEGKYRILDGVESTTAATIGDENDLAMEELEDEILSESQLYTQDEEAAKIEEEQDKSPPILLEEPTYQISSEDRHSFHEEGEKFAESSEEDNEVEVSLPTPPNEVLTQSIARASDFTSNATDLMPADNITDQHKSQDEEKERVPKELKAEDLEDTETQNFLSPEEDKSFHALGDVVEDLKKDDISSDNTPDKVDAPSEIPELTITKVPSRQTTPHELGIHFRIGEPYKSYAQGKSLDKNIIPDYAASTTAATIGDEDEHTMEELDDEILNDDENHPDQEDDGKNSEDHDESQTSPLGESVSRSTSLSDITDNTDELLEPNALEKAWSHGAGLDEDDELFRVLFRTPPRRRKHRNRSDINPRDVRKGKQEAMAFRTILDEEPVSPRRRENLSKRPFIPSWPFDPMSILDSRDLADLDRGTIRAVIDAQRQLMDEDRMPKDVNFSTFDEEIGFRSRDVSPFRDESFKSDRVVVHPPSDGEIVEELVKARPRSPSASPRMVGEEFIPGVPDFVHSVVPYQLKTPCDSKQNFVVPSPTSTPRTDPESMKFPDPIIKFRSPKIENGPDSYRYSPPVDLSSYPVDQCHSSDESEVQANLSSQPASAQPPPEAERPGASSGRSTPQCASGNASHSEGTSSSASKSSTSSFPRFIHSVFPFRRPSSGDRRSRSKTRRKREKKITKQKKKMKPRSKSGDKKTAKKPFPAIEVSSPPVVEAFASFPIVSSPAQHSALAQTLSCLRSPNSEAERVKDDIIGSNYDQESLDKIILSESDDAHSESDTPETVRRVEGSMAHENKEQIKSL